MKLLIIIATLIADIIWLSKPFIVKTILCTFERAEYQVECKGGI